MMTHRRTVVTALVLVAATATVAGGLLFSGVFTAQATQAPKMSLDMDPSGNGVSAGGFGGNLMTVGSIEKCATTNPGAINPGPFPPAPTFKTQLVVKDVEDLIGWQARFNYDGTKVGLSSFNETPFTSIINGAAIGFTNLPFDLGSGVHRGTTAASGTINAGTPSESTVIGASYLSAPTAPVSPDTPYIGDEGTRTYDAPSGGVLVDVIWTLKPGADGDPSVHLDLDDANPNTPGSEVIAFTGAGTTAIRSAETALIDGFIGVNTGCVVPATSTNPSGAAPTPAAAGADADAGAGDTGLADGAGTADAAGAADGAEAADGAGDTGRAAAAGGTATGADGSGGLPIWVYVLAAGLPVSAAGAFIVWRLRSRLWKAGG